MNAGSLEKLEKARNLHLPRVFRRMQHCQQLDFGSVRPVEVVLPTNLQDNTFVLFYATKFVLIFYSGDREVI